MGAQGHSLQFAHNRLQLRTFVAFLGPFLRELSTRNDDNRTQSWTIVDKHLNPHFLIPIRLSKSKRIHCTVPSPLLLSTGAKASLVWQSQRQCVGYRLDSQASSFGHSQFRTPNPLGLSGPLDRLNAILSLLQPLNRYGAPSAIGSAIKGPYLALSRIHAQVGIYHPPCFKPLGGLNGAIVAL